MAGTLASVLFLAWSLHRCLGPLVADPEPVLTSHFEIGPAQPAGGLPAEAPFEVHGLLVDGRCWQWRWVQKHGGWRERGPAYSPSLVLERPGPDPRLGFRGKRAVVLFPSQVRPETVAVARDGVPCAVTGEPLAGGRSSMWASDLPPHAGGAGSVWFWSLGSLVLAAFLVAPWRSARRAETWLVLHAGLLHLLVWGTQAVGFNHDSVGYASCLADNLRGSPAAFPPGYPLLMRAAGAIPWLGDGSAICLVQHVCMVVALVWLLRLLRGPLGETVAWCAVVAVSVMAPALFLPQAIMSENLALSGMAGALWFATVAARRGGGWALACAGLLAGWAGLARIVPLAAALPAFFVLLWTRPARRGLRNAGVASAVALGVVAAPIAWFGLHGEPANLTTTTGGHLFNRVVTCQRVFVEELPEGRRLRSLLGKDPRGIPHWDVSAALAERGLSPAESDALLAAVAVAGIRSDPLGYVLFSVTQTWDQLFAEPSPLVMAWRESEWEDLSLATAPPLGVTSAALAWRSVVEQWFRAIWPAVCWLALAGIVAALFLPERKNLLAIAWVSAAYLGSTALVEDPSSSGTTWRSCRSSV